MWRQKDLLITRDQAVKLSPDENFIVDLIGLKVITDEGNELGIISMLGFIMLAGLIVNNGIVLIDYVNQARREGMSKHEAIIDAGRTRLRPILMTAVSLNTAKP